MKPVKFSPSMMCVNPMKLAQSVETMEAGGIEYLHIDIMDGHFVPNITLGTDYARALHRSCAIPLDYHLMVEAPEEKIAWFDIRPGDLVSIHAESTRHLRRALDRVAEAGGSPMVAINPGTPLCALEEVLDCLSGVLIMTVNPGYAGQKLVESTIEKIARLRALLDGRGLNDVSIEVDGNVSYPNMQRMRAAGADLFVIGSSGFLKTDDPAEITAGIAHFRTIV